MKAFALAASAALAGLTFGASVGQAAGDPMGVWLDDTGRGAIEIAPCASGKGVCGHLVWVKDATDKRRGCGKQIIGEAKSVGGGRWDNGWIYSPDKKRNYDVELKPMDNGNLRVTGYAGVRFLSKTMIWKPAPTDLQRCSTVEAKAAPEAYEKPAVVAAVPASPAPSVEAKAPVAETAKTGEVIEPATKDPAPVAKDVAPAPKAEDSQETANSEPANDGADDTGNGRRGGLNLGDLDLDQVLTRTKGGKCKLDLPWVKVNFDCGSE